MKISILFQNDDFIAVDKPSGISVHNNEDSQNLLSLLASQLQLPNLLPVHRLDKETSGIQILSFHKDSARDLANEFQQRSVKKIYLGVLRGQLKSPEGIWTRPLTDKAEGRKNPEGQTRDRIPCETRFKCLKLLPYFSFCEFDLLTGRQHQIRKHCALINHAIVGDARYGDLRYNEKIAKTYKLSRMFLHCSRIEILDRRIESPMPQDFSDLMQLVGSVQK